MLCSSCRAFNRRLTSWEVVFLLFVANMLHCHTYSDVLPVLFLSVKARRSQQSLTATMAPTDPPRPYRSESWPSNCQFASAERDTGRHGAQAQTTDTTGHLEKQASFPVAGDGGRARLNSKGKYVGSAVHKIFSFLACTYVYVYVCVLCCVHECWHVCVCDADMPLCTVCLVENAMLCRVAVYSSFSLFSVLSQPLLCFKSKRQFLLLTRECGQDLTLVEQTTIDKVCSIWCGCVCLCIACTVAMCFTCCWCACMWGRWRVVLG